MLHATAEANNLAAVSSAKSQYVKEMEEVCGGDKANINPVDLEREHVQCLNRAIQLFKSTRKMGGPEFSQGYEDQLRTDVLEQFDHFQKHNESKNIFSAARTPAVLFTVMLVSSIMAGIFGVIGLESFASLCNFIMISFLVLMCSWFYLQYSGELRNVAQQIDALATAIWDHVKDMCSDVVATLDDYDADRARDQRRLLERLQDLDDTFKMIDVDSHQPSAPQELQSGQPHQGLCVEPPSVELLNPGFVRTNNICEQPSADQGILEQHINQESLKLCSSLLPQMTSYQQNHVDHTQTPSENSVFSHFPQNFTYLSPQSCQKATPDQPSHIDYTQAPCQQAVSSYSQQNFPQLSPQSCQISPYTPAISPQSGMTTPGQVSLGIQPGLPGLQAPCQQGVSSHSQQNYPQLSPQSCQISPYTPAISPQSGMTTPGQVSLGIQPGLPGLQTPGQPNLQISAAPQPVQPFHKTSVPTLGSNILGDTAFGSSQQPGGTWFKFIPPVCDDSFNKNGVVLNTKACLQCITAMTMYDNKSLEELRVEDYLLGRRKILGYIPTFGIPDNRFDCHSNIVSRGSLFGQNNQNISSIAAGLSSKLRCDMCTSMQEDKDMVQCCEGHLLCSNCVRMAAKSALLGKVSCPLQVCNKLIPKGFIRKILPDFVNTSMPRDINWENEWIKNKEEMDSVVTSGTYVAVTLSITDTEYKSASALFCHSMAHQKSRIEKVYRIENQRLWEKYTLTRTHMVEDVGETQINECRLFHGTSKDVVPDICEEGFDWRLCGKNATLYGKGAYFARDAAFSHRYATNSRTKISLEPGHCIRSGKYLMFIVKVLVGYIFKGDKSVARPPKDKSEGKTNPLHTAVDSVTDPAIFVVFDTAQSYPEYLIEYSPST